MVTESPRNISPFFPARGSGSPSSTIEYADSVPACAHMRKSSKRVRDKSTCRANQVLKLTDYHICRHMVSTFKRLTTTTTHCGLSIFLLNRRGLNHERRTLTPPVDRIVAVCSRHNSYNLASDRKSLDFYRSYYQSNYSNFTSTIQNMGT